MKPKLLSLLDLPTDYLARALLGQVLVNQSSTGITIGKIVETEAYLSKNDPACHASRGMTKRNAPMFGPAGTCYVYFIYGKYYCFNVVSGLPGQGEAVLIRGLEPIAGIELMKKRRKVDDICQLCNGPAKLVIAMGITMKHNRKSLIRGPLKIITSEEYGIPSPTRSEIKTTTRIGISQGKELPLRFYLKNNQFVTNRS